VILGVIIIVPKPVSIVVIVVVDIVVIAVSAPFTKTSVLPGNVNIGNQHEKQADHE
jgi:hypothetical protein